MPLPAVAGAAAKAVELPQVVPLRPVMPVAEHPVVEHPVVERPVVERPEEEHPEVEHPEAEHLEAEHPLEVRARPVPRLRPTILELLPETFRPCPPNSRATTRRWRSLSKGSWLERRSRAKAWAHTS